MSWVGRHTPLQQLGEFEALENGLTDGEAQGITLQHRSCFLWCAGAPVGFMQLLFTTLPSGESEMSLETYYFIND